jgi:hypothetical protein
LGEGSGASQESSGIIGQRALSGIFYMEPRRITVFFYGLFMDVGLLRAKGVNPIDARPGSVLGFVLRIGQRATLEPNDGASAYGIVMELSQAEIEQLYSEESVRAYRPEAVLCKLRDGSYIPALCFNLVGPTAAGEVDSEYATKLRELARRLQLPPDYVETIR